MNRGYGYCLPEVSQIVEVSTGQGTAVVRLFWSLRYSGDPSSGLLPTLPMSVDRSGAEASKPQEVGWNNTATVKWGRLRGVWAVVDGVWKDGICCVRWDGWTTSGQCSSR